jgi:solute carrier family 25 folate transporter 32
MDSKQNLSKKAVAPLFAGLSAGAVSTVLLLPLDNIKVRLQVHEGENGLSKPGMKRSKHLGGSLRLLRGLIRHEGVKGLYQGLTPAVLGSAVSWGGFFFVYEGLKRELKDRKGSPPGGNQTLTSWDNFQLACLSGAVMVAITNPVWLIKLRMQLQMKKASQQLQSFHQPYNGMVDAARTIVREEGFWALYKGAGPALLLTSHGGKSIINTQKNEC